MSQQFQFECQECGKCFLASRPDAQYCSNRCNQRAYRRRRKLLREAMRHQLTMDDVQNINLIKAMVEDDVEVMRAVDEIIRKYTGGLRTKMLLVLHMGVFLGKWRAVNVTSLNEFIGDPQWTVSD